MSYVNLSSLSIKSEKGKEEIGLSQLNGKYKKNLDRVDFEDSETDSVSEYINSMIEKYFKK